MDLPFFLNAIFINLDKIPTSFSPPAEQTVTQVLQPTNNIFYWFSFSYYHDKTILFYCLIYSSKDNSLLITY